MIKVFIIAFSTSVTCAFSQNLLGNPSFEESPVCPGGFSQTPQEFQVTGWTATGTGSPDYFHPCTDGDANVPYNWAGVSDAYDGKAYVGIFLWMMSSSYQYREYLQCKLKEPLIKDSTYIVSFRYKLSSYSKFAVDRIGYLLEDTIVFVRNDVVLEHAPTKVFQKDSAFTPATGTWEFACHQYKARGNEQYFVIGNFSDNTITKYYEIMFRPISQEMLALCSYYYIDDAEIIPKYSIQELKRSSQEFTFEHVTLNNDYVLRNVQFDFDSYKLLPQSFRELDDVVKFLLQNPEISVQVSGHTDDLGSDFYNTALSLNRAQSTRLYLETQGISKKRITTVGYGKTKPLVDGATSAAREMNRRVEIRFMK